MVVWKFLRVSNGQGRRWWCRRSAGALGAHKGIIANPNCVAIVAATPLGRCKQYRKRIVMFYLPAASGAGAAAMEELAESACASRRSQLYSKGAAASGTRSTCSATTPGSIRRLDTTKRTKVMQETRKIFNEPDLRVTLPACVCPYYVHIALR